MSMQWWLGLSGLGLGAGLAWWLGQKSRKSPMQTQHTLYPPPDGKPPPVEEEDDMVSAEPSDETEAEAYDLLISVMGLRGLPEGWKAPAPLIREWAGKVKPGHSHATWDHVADRLRDIDGRLIPNLIRQWGLELAGLRRLGLVGFSAGSSSGLRELLRHPEDRSLVDAVIAADGLHAALRPSPSDETIQGQYWDFDGQLGPFLEMARLGSREGGPIVMFTATDIARPSSGITKTSEAMSDVWTILQSEEELEDWHYYEVPELAQAPLEGFEGSRNLTMMWYPGEFPHEIGTPQAAHVNQAQKAIPEFLVDVVQPMWWEPHVLPGPPEEAST